MGYISCPARLRGGVPCPSKFTRTSNLNRHIRDFHTEKPPTVDAQPITLRDTVAHGSRAGADRDQEYSCPATTSGMLKRTAQDPSEASPTKRAKLIPAIPTSGAQQHKDTQPQNARPHPPPPALCKEIRFGSKSSLNVGDDFSRGSLPEGATTSSEPDIAPLLPQSDRAAPNEQQPGSPGTWRGSASTMPSLPNYEVRASTQQPGQPRVLMWLSQAARNAFAIFQTRALAKWGVSRDHDSTCIMDPADWANLEPVELMRTFEHRTSPTAHSQNRMFKLDDHVTNVPRATAWFAAWPRTGVELDNFLGDGPFKPMHGSHLCHHDNCIVPSHIVYEPADINMDRKDCHKRALRLRSSGSGVPARCESHQPPCLLRHAALSTFEVYLIQFHVLRLARRIDHPPDLNKPHWHLFPTFETSLPIRMPHIEGEDCPLVARHLASSAQALPMPMTRPQLECRLCVKTKAYVRLTRLWSHIVRQHDNVEDGKRLAEVRRTARLWQVYWRSRDLGKAEEKTLARMNEALGPNFSWEDVIAWDIR